MASMKLPRRSTISLDNRILIGIIADQETTVGFLLAGIGECTGSGVNERNFMMVTNDTKPEDIVSFFTYLYARKNIGVILIGQELSRIVAPVVYQLRRTIPIILEIPTKKSASTDRRLSKLN